MLQDTPSRRHKRSPTQTIESLRIPEALLKIEVVTAVTGRSQSTIRRMVAGQVSNWLRAKAVAA